MVKKATVMGKALKGRILLGVATLIACIALLGNVSAQDVATDTQPDLDVTVAADDTNLSGTQMVAWVDEQMGVVRGIYHRVQNMLDRARKEKETLKITCLDDKLTQIHVNMRGVEERKAALEVSVGASDNSSSKQQFVILKIYVARIQGLMAEAENCIGDTDVVIGESETIVTVDEDITMEDPTEPLNVEMGVDQPPHASAYF